MNLSVETTQRRKRTVTERITDNGDPLLAKKRARQAAKDANTTSLAAASTPATSAIDKPPAKSVASKERSRVRIIHELPYGPCCSTHKSTSSLYSLPQLPTARLQSAKKLKMTTRRMVSPKTTRRPNILGSSRNRTAVVMSLREMTFQRQLS